MSPHDQERLGVELCLKWPGKFQESDVAFWAKHLDGYRIEAIIDALTYWKNTMKFMPKAPEIKARLGGARKPAPTNGEPRPERSRADVFRRQMIDHGDTVASHQTDAQILLRFHAKVAYHAAMREPSAEGPPRRVLSPGYRAKILSECTDDLVSAGIDRETAERFADAVCDPGLTGDYMRQLLDDLQNSSEPAAV
jgi:hypothetical protein